MQKTVERERSRERESTPNQELLRKASGRSKLSVGSACSAFTHELGGWFVLIQGLGCLAPPTRIGPSRNRQSGWTGTISCDNARSSPLGSLTVPSMTTSQPLAFRIGLGYDSHRLGPGGPLRVGGLDIPGDYHAIGHSDADVLLHAVTDALMGAIAGPDIGRLFPDDADENLGRDSRDFVEEALRRVHAAGYKINNVDAVILAQKPKMAPQIDEMRAIVAEMLQTRVEEVGLKAKTGEGVDAVGRSEAIAARVIVMLNRR